MIQGVLFDMDGVLFDTESLCLRLTKEIGREEGLDIPDSLLCEVMGTSNAVYFQRMKAHFGPNVPVEEHYTKMKTRFAEYIEVNGPPVMKGVEGLLAYLQQNNYPMAVASSTKIANVTRYLTDAGIKDYFTTCIGGDMVGNYKPHPEIFQTAAAALGLPASCCLAIEDSRNGLVSASAAGCVTVMVPDMTPVTPELRALCTAVLGSLEEVPAFIEQYNKQN